MRGPTSRRHGSRTPNSRTRRSRAAGLVAAFTLGMLGMGAAPVAVAVPLATADLVKPRIAHVQTDGDQLQILLDVPADTEPDLASVKVSIGGEKTSATAEKADGTTTVERTAVLAIDTSNSMKGARFEAAKGAAKAYLAAVPADVKVGIVSFASEVTQDLAPTDDRDAALQVIDGLALTKQTRLYEGVTAAVEAAGTEGQRSVLLLSDGADTTKVPIETALSAIREADVTLDAVSLDQTVSQSLTDLAKAGKGRTIEANAENLAATFSAEAGILSRQILVSAEIPESFTGTEASVSVSLASPGGNVTAESFNQIREASVPIPAEDGSISLPPWAIYVGIGLVGLGLLLLLGILLPSLAPKRLTAVDRLQAYTERSRTANVAADGSTDSLASAKEAAANVLARNVTLDERISRRLEEAGSELRSSEWLVIHTVAVIGGVLIGALVSGGSFIILLLGLVIGVIGPWMYLGFRRGQRVKKFNAALPDTLQLMSGSMAAGLSLAQSIDTIVKEGSEPMSGEFKRVLIEARLGVPVEDALEGVTERFASKDFAWVVMAIKIQRQVGGNLAELLDTVAGTIREREYLRRQVASLSAEGKMSAWVLGLLPPLFLLYLVISQPDYVMPMFTEPMGWLMLAGAATMLAVGVFWMSRLVKVDV